MPMMTEDDVTVLQICRFVDLKYSSSMKFYWYDNLVESSMNNEVALVGSMNALVSTISTQFSV